MVRNLNFVNGTAEGTWSSTDASQPLTSGLVSDLMAGSLFVLVHTSPPGFGGGEIRGQVLPVTVTVVEVNDPPTANDDELTVEPDAPTTTLDVLANDTTSPDVDETLTITSIDTTNTTGTAAISGGGTGIDYTPPVGFKGTTTLEYTVGDGRGGQDAATVTIVVEKGTVTIAVPLGVGFNLIGVPVDFEQPLDFVGLAAQISAQADIDDNGDDIPDQIVSMILGWSAGSQVYRAFSPLNPGVNNDPLVKGQGYFVRLSKVPAGGFAWMATGRPVAAPVPLDFELNFNLVSVPNSTPAGGYDFASFSTAIAAANGEVSTILGWAAGSQVYRAFSPLNPGVNNDPIVEGAQGYFVRITTVPPAPFVP